MTCILRIASWITRAGIATAIAGFTAHAADYPGERPVKIVVAYPPGGSVDFIARALAGPLQTALKQPFVVENRTGAGGVVGTASVAKSAPDGYTLLIAAAGPLASTRLIKNIPYDPRNDFAAVAMVADVAVVLVSSTAFKPKTVAELIEHAKANPGKINLGINSVGSMHHMMAELFMLSTKTSMNRIPYKGAGQVMPDLVSGVLDLDMEGLPVVAEYLKAGRLHALAAASPRRLDLLPNTPTFAELGLPELVAAPWYAFVAPAGTPKEILGRLNTEINEILRMPLIKDQFAKQGANVVIATQEETGKFIRAEIERWDKVAAEIVARTN